MSTNLRKTSFLDDFELPIVSHETVKKQLLKAGKTRATKKSDSFGNLPIEQRLAIISKEVFKVLGRYKGFVRTIRSTHEFDRYIDKAIKKGVISFDTETNNSLDPLTCKIMGLCCYIPNTKPVYIPINHCKPKTEELIEGQISEEYKSTA